MATVGATVWMPSSVSSKLTSTTRYTSSFSTRCSARRCFVSTKGRHTSTIVCGIQAKGNKRESEFGKDIGDQDKLTAPVAEEPKEATADQTSQQEAATSTGPQATSQSAQQTEALSEDEIRRLANLRREQLREKEMGLVEGVVQEVGLIEWPKPTDALFNTALVLGIVAGVSLALFGVNSLLAELAKLVYGG